MISVSLQVLPNEIFIQRLSFTLPQLTGPDRRSKLSLLGVRRLFHSYLTTRFYDTLHLLRVRRWPGFTDRFEMGGLVDRWSRVVNKLRIRLTEQIVFGHLPDRLRAALRRLGPSLSKKSRSTPARFAPSRSAINTRPLSFSSCRTFNRSVWQAGSVAPSALSSRPNSPS